MIKQPACNQLVSRKLLLFFIALFSLTLVTSSKTWQESVGHSTIPVLLRLQQQNLDTLEKILYEVSDPRSEKYGKYFEPEHIADVIAPDASEIRALIEELNRNGASSIHLHRTRDYISCRFPKETFRRLFEPLDKQAFVGTRQICMTSHSPKAPETTSHIARLVRTAWNLADASDHGAHQLMTSLSSRRKQKEFHLRHSYSQAENDLGGYEDYSPFLPPPIPIFNVLSTSDNGFYLLVVPVCANNELSYFAKGDIYPFQCPNTNVEIEAIEVEAVDEHNSTFDVTKLYEKSELQKISYSLNDWCSMVYAKDPTAYEYYSTYCEEKFRKDSGNMGVMVVPLPGNEGTFFDKYTPVKIYIKTKFSNKLESPKVGGSQIVRKAYDIPAYDKHMPIFKNNTIMAAIGCGLNYFFNPKELDYFLHTFGQEDVSVKIVENPLFPVKNHPYEPGVEPSLDIEQQASLAYMSTHYFMPSNTKHCSTYEENILYYVGINELSNAEMPKVISQSSAFVTPDNLLPKEFIEATNVEFLKLAIRGVTYVVSAGDWGASGRYESDGLGCYPYMAPIYPASSPYVTSVGASQPLLQIINGKKQVTTQVCSADQGGIITGGGGHSWVQPIPYYQKEAVRRYQEQLYAINVDNLFPPNGSYNPQGRGYPDVSLFGWNTPVYTEEPPQWVGVGGTSISAPMFASIVSMINYERLKRGMPAMGFINPFLYAAAEIFPDAFLDITIGNNRCTEFGYPCCLLGYPALKGWDPASGLGSPIYENLLRAALELKRIK
eukprot:jgi/Galph1/4936/GphlegSOOS_G3556.1